MLIADLEVGVGRVSERYLAGDLHGGGIDEPDRFELVNPTRVEGHKQRDRIDGRLEALDAQLLRGQVDGENRGDQPLAVTDLHVRESKLARLGIDAEGGGKTLQVDSTPSEVGSAEIALNRGKIGLLCVHLEREGEKRWLRAVSFQSQPGLQSAESGEIERGEHRGLGTGSGSIRDGDGRLCGFVRQADDAIEIDPQASNPGSESLDGDGRGIGEDLAIDPVDLGKEFAFLEERHLGIAQGEFRGCPPARLLRKGKEIEIHPETGGLDRRSRLGRVVVKGHLLQDDTTWKLVTPRPVIEMDTLLLETGDGQSGEFFLEVAEF